ncbi:MAG: hypothetical protein AB7F59_10775 [Bdellovibrionales bacterium]
MHLSLGILFSFLLLSCASEKKQPETPVVVPVVSQATLMEQGLEAYKKAQWAPALEKFDQVIQSGANPKVASDAYYYSGICLKGLGRWTESIERFKKFHALQNQKNLQYQGLAFYEMAGAYEALSEDPLAIASLLDALQRASALAPEMKVEILARLASVYARIGNEPEAQKRYSEAETTLAKLRKSHKSKSIPPWLTKTLFNMGKMSLKKMTVGDFTSGLKPLERGQIWLLRAARFGDETWSSQAAYELTQVYRDAWGIIEAVPLRAEEDRLLALKEQQSQKVEMSIALYNLLSRLKLERGFDFQNENKYEKEIFENLTALEKNLELVLKSRPVEQALTPEGQESNMKR